MKKMWMVVVAMAILVACGSTKRVDLTSSDNNRGEPEAPSFTGEDEPPLEREAGLLSYCPSDKCAEPYTTCPGSRFLCDVNLSNDAENCGACGVACPTGRVLNGIFQCVSGKCQLECPIAPGVTADCDGIPDNGCETHLGNNDNCNACGHKCPDPDKPCIFNSKTKTGKCGCDAGFASCKNRCTDLQNSDDNCGACGAECPKDTDAGPPPPNSYYGCVEGECGHLKCELYYADCNGDLAAPDSDGCETYLVTTDDCGSCKGACSAGQECLIDPYTDRPSCLCAPGQKNCGTAEYPECVDINSDPANCGGCGIRCNLYYLTGVLLPSHYIATCTAGSCGFACEGGWADCNGRIDDGCEVNTNSDPNNCGGCGITCDAVAGQACVAGQCALEPCDQDGGLTR